MFIIMPHHAYICGLNHKRETEKEDRIEKDGGVGGERERPLEKFWTLLYSGSYLSSPTSHYLIVVHLSKPSGCSSHPS